MNLIEAFEMLLREDAAPGSAEEAGRVIQSALLGVCRQVAHAKCRGIVDADELASMVWDTRLLDSKGGRPRKDVWEALDPRKNKYITNHGLRQRLFIFAGNVAFAETEKERKRAEKKRARKVPTDINHGSTMASEDVRLEMRDLVSRLTDPKEMTFVRLHYYEGRSQKEIARLMGVSEGTISKLRARTLSNLRRLAAG